LTKKKAVNFVRLLSLEWLCRSCRFSWFAGAHRAPMPPLPIGATFSSGPSLSPGNDRDQGDNYTQAGNLFPLDAEGCPATANEPLDVSQIAGVEQKRVPAD
jgi:hypothetical protein